MSEKVKVRFAPSPTGPLHIGGVRTALYNYLFAKKHGGDFILRIEDTDQSRYVPGAEEYIEKALNWLNISYDHGPAKDGPDGPYRQSERKSQYGDYARRLIASGHAYYAFDTAEELEAMRERMKKAGVASPKYDHVSREYMKNSLTLAEDEVQKLIENKQPYVIRIRMPRNEEIKVNDIIRGWVRVQSSQLDDKVLYKSDGMPTYHLANVVDDHLMGITHVIRGEEWLPSAPLHVLLYDSFGWQSPQFAHLPLILKPDGAGKLSKRDGDRLGFPVFPLEWKDPVSGEISSGYKEQGYEAEAVLNILALLGWNPGGKQELFSKKELIEMFSLERVGKSGAKFDPDKAKWFNQQFLRLKDKNKLANDFMPILLEKGLKPDSAYVADVCELIKEKASFISEFWSLSDYFFIEPESYDEKVVAKKWKDEIPGFMSELAGVFNDMSNFKAEEIEKAFNKTAEAKGDKAGKYMQAFRLALSGKASGPAIFEMTELLGKETVVNRLKQAVEKL